MSNKSNLRFLVVLLFAAFATAALVCADVGALAQNANSSTTGDAAAQNDNSNGNMMGRRRRGHRRHRRGRRGGAAATAESVGMAHAAAGDVSGTQEDLSGTYTGHVRMSGGQDMDGDGTLTITNNQFTLESGGASHAGRVYAVTTRGYTGAAFYFSDIKDSTTNTPVVANVRARKSGDRLSLMPVPGSATKLWFGSGGRGGGGRGRRGRHGRHAAMPSETTGDATGTGDTSGAAAPGATGTGDETTTPAPRRRRGRRGRRGGSTNMNANSNMNTNSNTGDNSNAAPPR